MSDRTGRRRAGLLIPLFSCPSSESWGIGDIGDVEPVTAWLASAGQRVLKLGALFFKRSRAHDRGQQVQNDYCVRV